MKSEYRLLHTINSPEDLKKLPHEDIETLCDEIRQCIIETTEKNGGHLSSNLGVVELTVAMHRIFNCPEDHLIYDVGHQSYTHKLLTGRYNRFDSLREAGGITGFTNRDESEYDCFGAGHSSTSLSAALGFAKSDKIMKSDAYTVAVLGDGAFTGGMIHEALNNCERDLKLIIVLNENEMSISKNIGRFAKSLAKLRKKSGYLKAKRATGTFIKKIPLIGKGLFNIIKSTKKSIKNTLYGSNYFEDMGLYYLGPVDGNNYKDVEALLTSAKNAGESVLIHLKTQKGKGYAPAEADPDKYHGMAPSSKPYPEKNFSSEFGNAICDLAKSDGRICAITAAMSSGTGLNQFANEYPERFYDVGIAEEHAATFAAGLAANRMKPVFAVYSTFLQRSYDQMLHDVAIQRLPVVFCVDRAGFNNSDGVTHHGIFDVAFTLQIPGFEIYAPVTYEGLKMSLKCALNDEKPSVIRYSSGGEEKSIKKAFYSEQELDRISVKCDFSEDKKPDVLFITYGRIAKECLDAEIIMSSRGVCAGVVLCEYLTPNSELLNEIRQIICNVSPKAVVFVEEEIKNGGFGMIVSEKLRKLGALKGIKYDVFATEDPFVVRSVGESYLRAAGIDFESIAEKTEFLINKVE